jgi:hypothetical protein
MQASPAAAVRNPDSRPPIRLRHWEAHVSRACAEHHPVGRWGCIKETPSSKYLTVIKRGSMDWVWASSRNDVAMSTNILRTHRTIFLLL